MKNDDYKVEFENNRKEIELDHNDTTLLSRVERYGRQRKQKKTSRYTMINVILGVFTFIPILIFVYVIYNYYYGPDSGSAKVANNEVSVEVGTNSSGKTDNNNSVVINPKEDEDENASKGNADEEADEESESEKPVVNTNPPATEKEDSAKVTEKPKVEEKTTGQALNKTHIVAENETLYRISMNYYGSDAGIEKIMKANGLTSINIMAGQKLIIP